MLYGLATDKGESWSSTFCCLGSTSRCWVQFTHPSLEVYIDTCCRGASVAQVAGEKRVCSSVVVHVNRGMR